jgi:hypothetical protein
MINRERIAWDATTRGGHLSLSLSLSLSSRLANAAQERETRWDENEIGSVFLPLQREKKSDMRERVRERGPIGGESSDRSTPNPM